MSSAHIFIWLIAARMITATNSQAMEPIGHREEIASFASLMADVRTARTRCPALQVDDRLVTAEKNNRHIADVDYFLFRKLAGARADAIANSLRTAEAVAAWCAAVVDLYGVDGRVARGLLLKSPSP